MSAPRTLKRKSTKSRSNKTLTSRSNKSSLENNLIRQMIQLKTQIKFVHWNTKEYPIHMITDQFHEKLAKHIDEFVEVCIGQGLALMPIQHYYNGIKGIGDDKNQIINAMSNLERTIKKPVLKKLPRDMQAIMDEIVAEINQFKYLFKMST